MTLLSSSGCSASLLLIVNPVALKSISVKAPAEPLYPGDSVALSYTYSPSGPAVKNSAHLTAEEIDDMYWWLYNEVYSVRNIFRRIVFCKSFLRYPFRSMFNLGVNFFYRYHIKHNIAPIII